VCAEDCTPMDCTEKSVVNFTFKMW
jgi:hypothetical protein